MFRGRRSSHRSNIGVLLLLYQLFQFGFDKILPVTLLTIAGNVWIYLYKPYSIKQICISASYVYYMKDYRRILLSAVHHLSDLHLYYNMSSFLMKANFLERKFKSVYFAFLLAIFTGLCGVVYVALSTAYARLSEDPSHLSTCAAGFSGVIFALKVLTTHYSPEGPTTLFGIMPLPSKWIVWAELLWIQFLVPNTSFLGHLSGILVGLIYLHTPLKSIMDAVIPTPGSYSERGRYQRYSADEPRPSRYSSTLGGSGTSGYGRGDTDDLGQSRRAYGFYADDYNSY